MPEAAVPVLYTWSVAEVSVTVTLCVIVRVFVEVTPETAVIVIPAHHPSLPLFSSTEAVPVVKSSELKMGLIVTVSSALGSCVSEM